MVSQTSNWAQVTWLFCPQLLLFIHVLDFIINLILLYSLIHRCTMTSSPRQGCWFCSIIFIALVISNYLWAQTHNFTFCPVIPALASKLISRPPPPASFPAGFLAGCWWDLQVGDRKIGWREGLSLFLTSWQHPPSSRGEPQLWSPTSFSSPITSHQHSLCPQSWAPSIMPVHQPQGSFLWTRRSHNTIS